MRSLIISLRRFVLPFCVFILLIMLVVNVGLLAAMPRLQNFLADRFPVNLSCRQLFYLFPDRLIAWDCFLTNPGARMRFPAVRSPLAVIDVSFSRGEQGVLPVVSRVDFFDPVVFPQRLKDLWRTNRKELIAFFQSLPAGSMAIRVHGAGFERPSSRSSGTALRADLALQLTGRAFIGTGSVFKENILRRKAWLNSRRDVLGRFEVSGRAEHDRLDLDSVSWTNSVWDAKVWGGLVDSRLRLNGYAIGQLPGQSKAPVENPGIFLLDLNTSVDISDPVWNIESLSATLNNVPVSVRGHLNTYGRLQFGLLGSMYSSVRKKAVAGDYHHAEMNVLGETCPGGVSAQAKIKIFFCGANHEDADPHHNALIDVREVLVRPDSGRLLRVTSPQGSVSLARNGQERRLHWQRLKALFNGGQPVGSAEFTADLYGGHLSGRLWSVKQQLRQRVLAVMRLEDADANRLQELFPPFSKFHGRLRGKMVYENVPRPRIQGALTMQNGFLTGFDFFDWLADAFYLPELKKIAFETARTDFYVEPRRSGLPRLELSSSDVKVRGDFLVGEDDLVNSELRMGFSTKMLSRSPKFRPLLKLFDQDNQVDFFFKMSGNLDGMNFQWTESESKRRIQARIPDFIERRIEQGIDHSLEQVQESNQEKP